MIEKEHRKLNMKYLDGRILDGPACSFSETCAYVASDCRHLRSVTDSAVAGLGYLQLLHFFSVIKSVVDMAVIAVLVDICCATLLPF